MSTDGETPSSPPPSGASPLAKLFPLAPQILIGAAVVGAISVFLPGISISIPMVGLSESKMVVNNWRGIGGLLAYIAVGVVAFQMMSKKVAPRKQVLGVLIASGVAALLAVLYLAAVSDASGGAFGSAVKTGIGAYLNLIAAIALIGGAVVLAKREKLF